MSIHTRFVFKLFALAACVTAACSAAQAANNIRYVSITGSNANPCTLAKPCRTLQRGINMTPEGGELRILRSGVYGNKAKIRKSMTITGNGNTVFLGAILTIDTTAAVVALRELTLNGQGTLLAGISILTAGKVHIEDCVVHGFTDGILVQAPGADVFVIDSTARDNGNDGLRVATGAFAWISNSNFTGNFHGIHNAGSVVTRQNNTVWGNTFNLFGDPLVPWSGT